MPPALSNPAMSPILDFIEPYDFSPTLVIVCALAAVLYARGRRALAGDPERPGFWRALAYFLGLALIYMVMHTRIDYISQHMFWVHRAQHLVLHHLAPFLIMLSVPQAAIARGLPDAARRVLIPLWHSKPVQFGYRVVQFPIISAGLFVGLIFFWLTPSIHFDAMLSLTRYKAMNWSMALDGLLFWWLIVNPEPRGHGNVGFGWRILLLWIITVPQIWLGAHIALHPGVMYDVYNVCGRAWPVSPLVDQQIGGLITWIPASMMGVLAAVVVLRLWLLDSARLRAPESPVARAVA